MTGFYSPNCNSKKYIKCNGKNELHIHRTSKSTLCSQRYFLVFLLCFIYSTQEFVQARSLKSQHYKYNKTYPLTPSVRQSNNVSYNIAIITDLDTDSKSPEQKDTWQSYMMKGRLVWISSTNSMSVKWDKKIVTLKSTLGMKGRGMELSELVTFNGKLLTFDDKTGTVFILEGNEVYLWVILPDGNGKSTKGFKSEWATVKNEQLYVGSTGKEFTTPGGDFVNNDPQWIKIISPRGEVQSKNWIKEFERLRKAINITFPGYMMHESGVWSDVHHKWFFLPRRCSAEKYNQTKDESMSCNVLLIADENIFNIKVVHIGTVTPIRGFSSFKFLPGSKDSIIVALKSEEHQSKTATYITAFNINETIIMLDLKVSDKKFEGLDFI